MSYFSVGIILPENTDITNTETVSGYISETLGPYSEYNDDPEYADIDKTFDFYSIDKPYNGALGTYLYHPDTDEERIRKNSCKCKELIGYPMPLLFALVTPNGVYESSGVAGFFGAVFDSADDSIWHNREQEIFNKYAENYIVTVSCHI